jgi:CheY-like chemotaxis protein
MSERDPALVAPGRKTLLVMDNEVLIRMVLAEYLRHCGYRVLEAATTDEAVVLLQSDEVEIHLVLVDAEAEGAIGGFGLAKWVRQHCGGVSVLLAGNHHKAVEEAEDLCEKGPHGRKPYDGQRVADRIQRLLASQHR